MLTVSLLGLLSEGSAVSYLLAFDDLYSIVVVMQILFGIFALPFIIHMNSNAQSSLANIVMVFASGMPIVVVGAFSSAALWHKMVLSQLLLFAFWLIAFWLKNILSTRLHAGFLYVPICAILFFGSTLAGNVLTGFSSTGDYLSLFSVPSVLMSWAAGDYFGINGWFGVTVCIGALGIWSKKIAASQQS